MNDRSEISYWYEDDNILTVPTTKVPTKGEEIYINTHNEGVRGNFVVVDVKRYYKNYDIKHETDFGIEGSTTYVIPMQTTVETFEVYVERKKDL